MRATRMFGSRFRTRSGLWLAIMTIVSMLSLSIAPVASAQDAGTPEASPDASPAASPAAESQGPPPDVQALFVADFESLPAAPVTIRLLRITLEPGASVPGHTHPGPEFGLIEEGTLSATPTGDATVSRSDGGTTETVSEPTELAAGDWILYPAEVGMTFSNNTDSNVVILSAVIQPVGDGAPISIDYADDTLDTDQTARQTAYVGVSFVVLGDGLLRELPDGQATVAVNLVTLAAGAELPASDSPLLISRIDGNLSFTVDAGEVQVTRSAQQALAAASPPGTNYTLETGDAAFFPSGVNATSREAETGEVSYFSLSIAPSSAIEGETAQLTYTEPTETTPEATSTPSDGTSGTTSDGLAPGTVVTALEDNVNVRAEASVDADVVEQVAADVEMNVVSGPTDADDYSWYEVEIVSSGLTGWVVEDFIVVPGAAEASPKATAEDTSGTPEAQVNFAEGDVVVVNDTGVRIRVEASVDGEVVDTIEEGTELTIVSGPEDADDYSWYEVETADGELTGWIVSDFIEPATAE